MASSDRQSNPYQPLNGAGLGGSVLGWVRKLFAAATPVYRGDGQPGAQGGGLFGSTPSYRVPLAPPTPPVPPVIVPEPAPAASGEPDVPDDDAPEPHEATEGHEAPETAQHEPAPTQGSTAYAGAVTIVIATRN